jgi:hypothetical protein
MTNVPGLRSLADTLFRPTPTIHFAKEATVAGIAAFRSDHYEVMPIFAAGTCKKEKAPDCGNLIQTLLNAWRDSPDGEKRHGPIWSVASDGDGVRRAAFHALFMSETVKPIRSKAFVQTLMVVCLLSRIYLTVGLQACPPCFALFTE